MTQDEINLDHSPLTFGMHKGKTPDEISETEAGEQYIRWMFETVKNKPTCSRTLYEACGGAKERLQRAAEDTYKELDPDEDIHL